MHINDLQNTNVVPQMRNRRILAVDDDPTILELFRRTFVYKDSWLSEFAELFDEQTQEVEMVFDLSTALQGDEAVKLVKQALDDHDPIAVVFMDVRMPPGIDGLEAARKIREIDPDIHIVISSAYNDYQPSDFRMVIFSHLYFMRKPLVLAEVEHMAYNACFSWNRNQLLQQELNNNIAYQSWLGQLFEDLPMPIMVIDVDSYQVLMSGGSYQANSVTTCYKLRYGRDTPCDDSLGGCPIEKVRESGSPSMTEHLVQGESGGKHNYEIHCAPIYSHGNDLHQVLEFSMDVTERQYRLLEKEAQVRQQKQLFDTFRSTAHTMKNSISYLNGIVDHIAAIEDRPGELGQLLSYERMELVQEQVSMIQTLLLLALKNAKGDANKVTALQVRKKTNEALSLFSISTLGKGKTVELTMPAEEFCVHISSIDWQTMLINLLNNAADAADQYLVERTTDISPDNLIELVELQEKSMITLNVSQQRDRVYIEISNIGTPIPIDILPTIFEQGYTTKDVGNGVGLYDVRQILKQARGDISVYNREDGVTFELYLPIVDCE